MHIYNIQPAHWPSGVERSGRQGFNPRPCHTKDLKNGI